MSSDLSCWTTDRLRAEAICEGHLAALDRLHGDPRVMHTLSADGKPLSEAAARRAILANCGHWEQHQFGLWTFFSRTDDRLVGRAGLRRAQVRDQDEVELAYAVAADDWGKGFATEMSRAVLERGFEALLLRSVVAYTLTHNKASQRVMMKLGFQYEAEFEHVGLPHVLFRLNSAQWQ